MDHYQRDYDASETQYQDFEYQQFKDHGRTEDEEQVRMFNEQKTKYINFGALRGDQPQSQPGYHHQPANTWCRGHPKYYRCRG